MIDAVLVCSVLVRVLLAKLPNGRTVARSLDPTLRRSAFSVIREVYERNVQPTDDDDVRIQRWLDRELRVNADHLDIEQTP